jgi:hypothetical protein
MEAVLFSSYFPNIRYFSKFLIYDKLIIDIYESYSKQTYRNRCKILTANGVSSLIVPVKKNFRTHFKDIEIEYSENWQANHSRAILSAYKNSPFYEYYIDAFVPLLEKKEKYLLDLNNGILETSLKLLSIKPNFEYSTSFLSGANYVDLKDAIHPKTHKNIDDRQFLAKDYIQVFSQRHGFCPDLSILDLLFNEGPLSLTYIKSAITNQS